MSYFAGPPPVMPYATGPVAAPTAGFSGQASVGGSCRGAAPPQYQGTPGPMLQSYHGPSVGPMGPAGPFPGGAMGSVAAPDRLPMRGPFPSFPGVPYEVAQHQVADRLSVAMQKRKELVGDLDVLTDGAYNEHFKDTFSTARKAGIDGVDWRVTRLAYCKDPQHNVGVQSMFAHEVHQRKAADAELLEHQLGSEAHGRWAEALQVVGKAPPPLEITAQRPVPFVEAVPNYVREDDVWSRTLELRTLDEAMRGDVSKPLPRPAVHTEDYQNFREGRYLKDDCPIA